MPSSNKAAAPAVAKKELSTNNYIAAVIAITLIIVIICGLIGKGMIGSLVINTKIIAGKVQAKSDLDTKLANIPTLLQNYQSLGNAKQLIADGLPNDPDFPQIVSIMQGISTASGVGVKDVSPAGATSSIASTSTTSSGPSAAVSATGASTASSSTPQSYSFATSVAAPYAQMLRFFHDLEISDRPMQVASAHFSGDSSNLSVDLNIKTYYQGKADVNDKMEAIK